MFFDIGNRFRTLSKPPDTLVDPFYSRVPRPFLNRGVWEIDREKSKFSTITPILYVGTIYFCFLGRGIHSTHYLSPQDLCWPSIVYIVFNKIG